MARAPIRESQMDPKILRNITMGKVALAVTLINSILIIILFI